MNLVPTSAHVVCVSRTVLLASLIFGTCHWPCVQLASWLEYALHLIYHGPNSILGMYPIYPNILYLLLILKTLSTCMYLVLNLPSGMCIENGLTCAAIYVFWAMAYLAL